MNAVEFFRKVGVDAVKSYINAYDDHLTDDLKRLVESWELVNKFEGLDGAKLTMKLKPHDFNSEAWCDLNQAIKLVEQVGKCDE